MALPKSTFVMGGAVLALFGVAAYKTATDPAERATTTNVLDEDSYRRAREEAGEAASREQDRREEIREATRTAYGAEPATLGRLFDGVSIGRDRDALSPEAFSALQVFRATTDATITFGPGSTGAIGTITVGKIPMCATFGFLLRNAWGNGDGVENASTMIWVNHLTHLRAVFTDADGGCSLAFAAYTVPEEWVSTLSLDLVGAPAKSLPSAEWDVPGVGAGTEMTHVNASTNGRTVTSVTATTTVTERTREVLIHILTAKYGTPKETVSDTNRTLRWPAPRLSLAIDGDAITLTAGRN